MTPQQQHLRFTGLRLDILLKAIAFAIFLVPSSLVLTYVSAASSASSIQDGETTAVDVRYRSFSGSAGQVTERDLALFGATQKAVFFYDADENNARTIVIPQAQIVSIEVPE